MSISVPNTPIDSLKYNKESCDTNKSKRFDSTKMVEKTPTNRILNPSPELQSPTTNSHCTQLQPTINTNHVIELVSKLNPAKQQTIEAIANLRIDNPAYIRTLKGNLHLESTILLKQQSALASIIMLAQGLVLLEKNLSLQPKEFQENFQSYKQSICNSIRLLTYLELDTKAGQPHSDHRIKQLFKELKAEDKYSFLFTGIQQPGHIYTRVFYKEKANDIIAFNLNKGARRRYQAPCESYVCKGNQNMPNIEHCLSNLTPGPKKHKISYSQHSFINRGQRTGNCRALYPRMGFEFTKGICCMKGNLKQILSNNNPKQQTQYKQSRLIDNENRLHTLLAEDVKSHNTAISNTLDSIIHRKDLLTTKKLNTFLSKITNNENEQLSIDLKTLQNITITYNDKYVELSYQKNFNQHPIVIKQKKDVLTKENLVTLDHLIKLKNATQPKQYQNNVDKQELVKDIKTSHRIIQKYGNNAILARFHEIYIRKNKNNAKALTEYANQLYQMALNPKDPETQEYALQALSDGRITGVFQVNKTHLNNLVSLAQQGTTSCIQITALSTLNSLFKNNFKATELISNQGISTIFNLSQNGNNITLQEEALKTLGNLLLFNMRGPANSFCSNKEKICKLFDLVTTANTDLIKESAINALSSLLGFNNSAKKEYVTRNIAQLFDLASEGKTNKIKSSAFMLLNSIIRQNKDLKFLKISQENYSLLFALAKHSNTPEIQVSSLRLLNEIFFCSGKLPMAEEKWQLDILLSLAIKGKTKTIREEAIRSLDNFISFRPKALTFFFTQKDIAATWQLLQQGQTKDIKLQALDIFQSIFKGNSKSIQMSTTKENVASLVALAFSLPQKPIPLGLLTSQQSNQKQTSNSMLTYFANSISTLFSGENYFHPEKEQPKLSPTKNGDTELQLKALKILNTLLKNNKEFINELANEQFMSLLSQLTKIPKLKQAAENISRLISH